MTQRDMAGYLNIDVKTLRNWKKNKPNLYKTVMLGLKANEIVEEVQKSADALRTFKLELEDIH